MAKAIRNIILLSLVILFASFAFSHQNRNEYGKWLDFHNLNFKSFEITGDSIEKKMVWIDYDLSKDYISLFQPFFIYSDDSLSFLDLDSYSLVLEKDDKGNMFSFGSGVDVKVQLINVTKMSSTTLLFCGTNCYPETAMWMSKSQVEIYGFTINDADKFVPTIWKIDIENMIFTEKINSKLFHKMPPNYSQKKRLKNIAFK